jgi:polar amino acid transport system substrate-binding protein
MRFIIPFLLCCFSPLTIFAEQETIVFVYENYPPYEYMDNGVNKGIDIDIIREVCKQIGIVPEFKEYPWKRALKYVEVGKVDAIFSLFKTPERTKFLYYPTTSVNTEKTSLFTLKENNYKVNKLSDLKEKIIGVVAEYSYGREFDTCEWIKKDIAFSVELQLEKQSAGRTDFSVVNELVGIHIIKKLKLGNKIKKLDYTVGETPLYVAFSKAKGKKAQELSDKFSAILSQLKEEGILEKITKKYL